MKKRIGLIIGWICALLVAAFNLFAAVMKFIPVEPGSPADQIGQQLGIRGMEYELAVLELIVILLFLIPRTMTIGFVLMIGYMGGVLATNLTHGFSHADSLLIYISFALLTISAYFRNPELLTRLRKGSV
ncbi:DoxX family protein [Candidatus Peregrinibacteria bacterium]|nr:DoxX family protein [Candidatus Peregrinibacteria bacterium]